MQNQQIAFAFAKETGCGFESVFHQGVRPKLLDPQMDIGGLFSGAARAFEFDAFGKCFAEFHGQEAKNEIGTQSRGVSPEVFLHPRFSEP